MMSHLAPRRFLTPVCAFAAIAIAAPADAVVLVQAGGDFASSSTRPGLGESWGHVGPLVVGGQSVPINSIGILGRVLAPTELSWVIYANTDSSTPIFQTAPVSYSPSASVQWYDSPDFSNFTLQANTVYWLGFVVNAPDESFEFFYNELSLSSNFTATGGGLTLPGVRSTTAAANLYGGFESPTIFMNSRAHLGLRVSGVPEPSTAAACLLSGAVLVLRRRRGS